MGRNDHWRLIGCLITLAVAFQGRSLAQDIGSPLEFEPASIDDVWVVPASAFGPPDLASSVDAEAAPLWGGLQRLPPADEQSEWPGGDSVLNSASPADPNSPATSDEVATKPPPYPGMWGGMMGGGMMGGGMMGGGMMGGGMMGGGMMGGGMGGMGFGSPISDRAYWLPERDLRGQPGTLSAWGDDINFMIPVYRDAQNMWAVQSRVHEMSIDTTATLPSLNRAFPTDLWNINLGVSNFRRLDNGWMVGGNFGFGSASDRPFDSLQEMNVNAMAFLRVPSGDRNAWNFSLTYSPMGQLPYPIPGVSYQWRPNDQFQANVGIPFMVMYRPRPKLFMSLMYMPLTTINGNIRYMATPQLSFYGAFQSQSESYFLTGRIDPNERFYAYDQRLTVGARQMIGTQWAIDVSTAYVFNRSYYLAESFASARTDNVGVANGLAASLQFSYFPWARPARNR